MTKQWTNAGEGKYVFTLDGNQIGQMQIEPASADSRASCQIGDDHFTIKRTGFWKSTVEVLKNDGNLVAKTYHEKWYANSSVLEYENQKYNLTLHNNPLAEWAIVDEGKTLLAYGLNAANGKTSVRISGEADQSHLLLDFLLWYLFVPIASENMGDNFVFHLLTTAQ